MLPRSRSMRVVCPSILAVAAALAVASAATAQPGHDPAAAEQLFARGKDLLQAGDWPVACAKFQASMDLDPAVGTLLKLAKCHEHDGKLARAWADYRSALAMNRDQPGQTEARRAELADFTLKAIAALEPRIPKLRVLVRDKPPGLKVQRDGLELPAAALGEPLPADPGTVVIDAEAPGYQSLRRTVVLVEGKVSDVELTFVAGAVPAPAPEPLRPPADSFMTGGTLVPAAAPRTSTKLDGRRIGGIVVGSAGVVGLGVGLGLAVDTMSKVSASSPYCTPNNQCLQQGFDLRNTARTTQTAALVSLGVGAALVATGVALVVAPPSGTRSVGLALSVGPSDATITVVW
jgi:hypothetical protein